MVSLNAHAVLPRRWIERPEELPAAKADRRFQPLQPRRVSAGSSPVRRNITSISVRSTGIAATSGVRSLTLEAPYPAQAVTFGGPYAEVRRSRKVHDYWEGED